jgi:hypothetical protein
MPRVGTQKILGTEVEVHANSSGFWSIMLGDKKLGGGSSLEKAVAQARQTLNLSRVDVSIPFFTMQGSKGVATKIHAKTGNVMARVGNKSVQVEPRSQVFKGDTPKAKRERYLAITEEMRKLRSEQRQIEQAHTMNLGQTVKKTIDEVNAEEDAA